MWVEYKYSTHIILSYNDLENVEIYKPNYFINSGSKHIGTEWEYTGVNFTIPENSIFVMSASCAWNTYPPVGIGITKQSPDLATPSVFYICDEANDPNNFLCQRTCTISGMISSDSEESTMKTFYVWAKYLRDDNLSHTNSIWVEGFYFTNKSIR